MMAPTRRSLLPAAAAAFAIVLVATACAADPAAHVDRPAAANPAAPSAGPPAVPVGLAAIAAARLSQAAPREVRETTGAASCGEFVLGLGQSVPETAISCLRAAEGSFGAQLAIVAYTTEGDPIVDFFFTREGEAGFVVHGDSQWDDFGSRDWSSARCSTLPPCGLLR